MGKKDIYTSDYFEDNKIFADLANGILFGGKQTINPDCLKEANKELLFPYGKNKVTRDNVKKYFKNTLVCIYVLEHQTHVDYHMVLRNMLAEALEYHRQWNERQKEHREKKDIKQGDEFISGMKKKEHFTPVITLVIYYGKEKWDGARSLHELLDFKGAEEELKPYVSDYRIHVFDYHEYQDFDMFHTELKQVFSFLKCSENKTELRRMLMKRREEYQALNKETCELIAVLTNSKELLGLGTTEKEGGNDMCKALEDIKLEGIVQGKQESIIEWLEEYGEIPQRLQDRIKKEEDVQVLKTWNKLATKVTTIEEFLEKM